MMRAVAVRQINSVPPARARQWGCQTAPCTSPPGHLYLKRTLCVLAWDMQLVELLQVGQLVQQPSDAVRRLGRVRPPVAAVCAPLAIGLQQTWGRWGVLADSMLSPRSSMATGGCVAIEVCAAHPEVFLLHSEQRAHSVQVCKVQLPWAACRCRRAVAHSQVHAVHVLPMVAQQPEDAAQLLQYGARVDEGRASGIPRCTDPQQHGGAVWQGQHVGGVTSGR